ncbi:MAG TPA: hypothetical protein VIV88_02785 [Gemmatimonadales bacterium]|jgi:hypothetical protein
MNGTIAWIALGVALTASACGSAGSGKAGTAARDTLTERQRDSILAGSRIPGARGVGAALRAADSTNARIRAADSVTP